jgi:aryl-alcohol dehydrogenase-like predicted oxidoreductase
VERRRLGDSGVEISRLCLGTWPFGSDRWWGYQDDGVSREVMELALDAGVNCFDTAPVYGRGHAEEIIGEFCAGPGVRERIIIATKLGLRWEGRRVWHDLTTERMRIELDDSRRRLRTDYIDLYQIHWPDPAVPIADTADQLRRWYEAGIVRAVGVSNFSVEQLAEFSRWCPLHAVQLPCNMFSREIERQQLPYCRERGLTVLTYSSLAAGVLTGKFFDGTMPVPGDFNRKYSVDLQEPRLTANKNAFVELKLLAEEAGISMAQLALAWILSQPELAPIVGARNRVQLQENAEAVEICLTGSQLKTVDDILTRRDECLRMNGY